MAKDPLTGAQELFSVAQVVVDSAHLLLRCGVACQGLDLAAELVVSVFQGGQLAFGLVDSPLQAPGIMKGESGVQGGGQNRPESQ
jgi:hypothetical protein